MGKVIQFKKDVNKERLSIKIVVDNKVDKVTTTSPALYSYNLKKI